MRNLIAATLFNTLAFTAVFLTIDGMRAMAVVILALGTYLVFSFGRLEGAQNMMHFLLDEEKEINE